MNRVAYLVGHHHRPEQINGIDYQILIEADYIVNASENGYSQQAIRSFMEHTMKTVFGVYPSCVPQNAKKRFHKQVT